MVRSMLTCSSIVGYLPVQNNHVSFGIAIEFIKHRNPNVFVWLK